MQPRPAGNVAVVTGATGGIGKEIARGPAQAAMTVVIGAAVTANCAEPGFVRTDLNRHASGFRTTMINISVQLFGVSPAKGAATPLWVATAPELEGVIGKCFAKRKAKPDAFREPAAIADLERPCRELEHDRGT